MSDQLAVGSDPHREFELFCRELILEQVRGVCAGLPGAVLRGLPDAFEYDLAVAVLGRLLGTRVLRRSYDFGRKSEAVAGDGMQRKPGVGNIVHFTECAECSPVAAIVTGVEDPAEGCRVFLHTFPVAGGVGAAWSHVPFSVVSRPGYWSWPSHT